VRHPPARHERENDQPVRIGKLQQGPRRAYDGQSAADAAQPVLAALGVQSQDAGHQ
jgi:hypothetical protein